MNNIKKSEWEKIIDLAIKFTFAKSPDQENYFRSELLKELSLLHDKYGRDENILATQAEYTLDIKMKQQLLTEAFKLATLNQDIENEIMIASSLADLYFDLGKDACFEEWTRKLKEALDVKDDPFERKHYEYLINEWNKRQNM